MIDTATLRQRQRDRRGKKIQIQRLQGYSTGVVIRTGHTLLVNLGGDRVVKAENLAGSVPEGATVLLFQPKNGRIVARPKSGLVP